VTASEHCPGSGQFGLWSPSRYIEDGEPSLAVCPVCGRRVDIVGTVPGRLAEHAREADE
jgi:hypothetical protein